MSEGTSEQGRQGQAGEREQWMARIQVTLKPVVLDPQGEAVVHGLRQLGFAEVAAVRVGKYLEVTLAAEGQEAAEATVRAMCERLLANPVIERYAFTVEQMDVSVAHSAPRH